MTLKNREQIAEIITEVLAWPVWAKGRVDMNTAIEELETNGERLGIDLTGVAGALLDTSKEEFDEVCVEIEHTMGRGDLSTAESAIMSWIVYGMISYTAGVMHGRELGLSGGDGHVVDTPHD